MDSDVFLLIFLCVFVFTALRFFLGGRQSEAKFREDSNTHFVFRERGASGYSKRSVITTIGGATRALEVAVTENELWIKGILPMFTFIGEHFDLSHKVPIASISGAARDGSRVELSFRSEKGEETHVSLVLRDPESFIAAISRKSTLT